MLRHHQTGRPQAALFCPAHGARQDGHSLRLGWLQAQLAWKLLHTRSPAVSSRQSKACMQWGMSDKNGELGLVVCSLATAAFAAHATAVGLVCRRGYAKHLDPNTQAYEGRPQLASGLAAGIEPAAWIGAVSLSIFNQTHDKQRLNSDGHKQEQWISLKIHASSLPKLW